ncbi:MAG: 3'-5' exonuclease [Cyclobacteriaceae bacterium]|nr:3'-5' exonuclease [Cyclobacteriaceae bacterium HetDA_MAG_MS6]
MIRDLKNILVIDIETVSASEHLEEISPAMQKHWQRKSIFIKNDDELSAEQLYFDRAAIYAEFGKVIVIAVGIFHQVEQGEIGLRVMSFANHDEKQLLNDFKTFLETKFDQETLQLCAHNGKEFDFPYLSRRMFVNRLGLPYTLDISGRKPWEVQHIDTMELWKFGDRKSFTSLDLLANLFDIPSSKDDIDGSQVNPVYYQEESGLERIARYCERDVVVTAQLYLQLKNLPLITEAHTTFVS